MGACFQGGRWMPRWLLETTQVEMDAGASTFAAGSAVFKSDDRPALVLVLGNHGHRFSCWTSGGLT